MSQELREKIIKALTEKDGEHLSPWLIGKAAGIKMKATELKAVCNAMVEDGSIRRGGARSGATYYLPTARQLRAEQMTPMARPELKPRPEHAAIISRIRALRAAIPSKG